ncbi:24231_t:CDS:2, partial [Dentiscutata erythropus]
KNLEVQATNTIIIESQREISPDHTNMKKRRENKEASLINGDNNTIQSDNSRSYTSKRQNEQTLNSSSLARNNSSEGFYSQQLLISNNTLFSSYRSPNKYAGLISGGGN